MYGSAAPDPSYHRPPPVGWNRTAPSVPGVIQRPRYRQWRPIRPLPALAGAGGSLLLFLLTVTAIPGAFLPLSMVLVAALLAAAAVALARWGDRGVAVGVACAAGCAAAITVLVVWVMAMVAG